MGITARRPGEEDEVAQSDESGQVKPLLTEIDHIAIAVPDLGEAIDYYRETFGYRPEDFPVARAAFERLISLPIYPRMTREQVERVVAVLSGASSD